MAGLFCFAKKKKKKLLVAGAVPVCVEEQEVVQETITTGPGGGVDAAAVDIEGDIIMHAAGGGAGIVGATGPHCESEGSSRFLIERP